MKVKEILDEDFVNYRQPSMFIGTISCGGKCCIEVGVPLSVCQNDGWRSCSAIEIEDMEICKRYMKNDITKAVVFGGLEPFEQFDEMKRLIHMLRTDYACTDDVVIYTGYTKMEVLPMIRELCEYKNIVIKFGRFVPNREHIYDDVLGVYLASDNQYAERIS